MNTVARFVLLLALTAICLPATVGAQPSTANSNYRIDTAFVNRFEAGTLALRGIVLPYRLATIGPADSTIAPALVVYLHSRSANGNDNSRQVSRAAVKRLYNHLDAANTPAMLLVPQCPDNRNWNERYTNGWQMTAVVKETIDTLTARYHIDPKRIYIFADASGGAGVWRMISDYPDLFAAAMVAGSYPGRVNEKNAARTPLCCIIGDSDDVAPRPKVEPTIEHLKKRGADIRFIELPHTDHVGTSRYAYTDDNINWVLNHRRP